MKRTASSSTGFPYSTEFLTEKLKQLHERSAFWQEHDSLMGRFIKGQDGLSSLAEQAKGAMARVAEQEWSKANPGKPFDSNCILKTETVYIEDLWAMIQHLAVDRAVLIEELSEKNPKKAIDLLMAIIGTKVTKEGNLFLWKYPYAYVPQMSFAVDGETPLRYDDCGRVIHPLILAECPFLQYELGVDFDANDVWIAKGRFIAGDDGPIFLAQPVQDHSTHLLVVAKWGGAHSKTKGCTPEVTQAWTELAMDHFEHITSKKGGEGCDFYVLRCDQPNGMDLVRSTIEASVAKADSIAVDEATFTQKFVVLNRLQEKDEELQERLRELKEALENMSDSCIELAADPDQTIGLFAHVPEYTIPDYENTRLNYSRTMDLSTLLQIMASDDTLSDLTNYEDMAAIHTAAWKSFAPRYAKLQPVVARLHGWMEIFDEYTTIVLPARESAKDGDTRPIEKVFWFSEKQLNECIEFLQAYANNEAADAKKNTTALQNLLESVL